MPAATNINELPCTGDELRRQLEQLRTNCLVPGISVAAIQYGKFCSELDLHVGCRRFDLDDILPAGQQPGGPPPSGDTIYTLASLSKLFVTSAFCILVNRGLMRWDDRISDHVEDYRPKDDATVASASFAEVLNHTAGIDNPVVTWLGPDGACLISQDNFIELLNSTPTTRNGKTLREGYLYSNVAYGLVVLAIEKVSGIPFAEFLQNEILTPLRMTNTIVTAPDLQKQKLMGNLARSYVKLSTGDWEPINNETWTDEVNGPLLGMIGIRSSTKDMLTFVSALMDAYTSSEAAKNENSLGVRDWSSEDFELLSNIDSNPLVNVAEMLDYAYTLFDCDCRGSHDILRLVPLVRTMMPCKQNFCSSFNTVSCNDDVATCVEYSPSQSYIGHASDPKRLVFSFNGISFCGTAAIKLFPETQSAVIAFASGLNGADAAEYASLLVTRHLFNLKPERDLFYMVNDQVQFRDKYFNAVMEHVESHAMANAREQGLSSPLSLCLDGYTGEYEGFGTKFFVDLEEAGLMIRFKDRSAFPLPLKVHDFDCFSFWPDSKDEWLRRGMLDWDSSKVGLLQFHVNSNEATGSTASTMKVEWLWEKGVNPAFYHRL